MKKVVITIPIYKEKIDKIEEISLKQALDKLSKHPFVFFAPNSLDVTGYEVLCKGKVNYKFERFDDEYFTGIPGYNKLMLNQNFYKRFLDYKYILIYQLDAFVFNDDLEYWCDRNFDYIGAPYIFVDLNNYPIKVLTKYRKLLDFFEKLRIPFYEYKHLGNGGFSLRNVKSTINLLRICKKSVSTWNYLMEDSFFQYWGNVLFPLYKLPTEIEAAKFSIELDPAKTFELIGKKLPFGCHAFMRYDPEFWKPYILKDGHKID